jgi:heme O synthase-like polyprenyltransferase
VPFCPPGSPVGHTGQPTKKKPAVCAGERPRTGHALYLGAALVAGLAFLFDGLLGLRHGAGVRWARNLFALSLAYLPVVFGALMIDR